MIAVVVVAVETIEVIGGVVAEVFGAALGGGPFDGPDAGGDVVDAQHGVCGAGGQGGGQGGEQRGKGGGGQGGERGETHGGSSCSSGTRGAFVAGRGA